jgi:hypothetical protein
MIKKNQIKRNVNENKKPEVVKYSYKKCFQPQILTYL